MTAYAQFDMGSKSLCETCYLFFSVFKCPHKCSVGLRSGNWSPWHSGLLGLLWSCSSFKALRCVSALYPAAEWILFHRDRNQMVEHVSEEWSGTSPWSEWSYFWISVKLQRTHNSPVLGYSQQLVSLWVRHTGISFSSLLTYTVLFLPSISYLASSLNMTSLWNVIS